MSRRDRKLIQRHMIAEAIHNGVIYDGSDVSAQFMRKYWEIWGLDDWEYYNVDYSRRAFDRFYGA